MNCLSNCTLSETLSETLPQQELDTLPQALAVLLFATHYTQDKGEPLFPGNPRPRDGLIFLTR